MLHKISVDLINSLNFPERRRAVCYSGYESDLLRYHWTGVSKVQMDALAEEVKLLRRDKELKQAIAKAKAAGRPKNALRKSAGGPAGDRGRSKGTQIDLLDEPKTFAHVPLPSTSDDIRRIDEDSLDRATRLHIEIWGGFTTRTKTTRSEKALNFRKVEEAADAELTSQSKRMGPGWRRGTPTWYGIELFNLTIGQGSWRMGL